MSRLVLALAVFWTLLSGPAIAQTVQRPSGLPILFAEPAFTLESFGLAPIIEAKTRALVTSMHRSCQTLELYAWAPRPGESPSALTSRMRSGVIEALQKAGSTATPLQGSLLATPDSIADGVTGKSSAIVHWHTLANATIIAICQDVPIWWERAVIVAVLLILAAGCLLAHLHVERQWIRQKLRVTGVTPRHVDHSTYGPETHAWRVSYSYRVGHEPRAGSSILPANAPEAPPGETITILRPKGRPILLWCASRGPADLSVLQLAAMALVVTAVWVLGLSLFK